MQIETTAAQADVGNPGHVYELYFLGGQSNMEGFGYVAEIDPALRSTPDNVVIYHGKSVEDGKDGGGAGLWAPLKPGHGLGFDTDGTTNMLSDRFGPELTFAHSMSAAAPTARIAIVKFSRGGTGLIDGVSGFGSWDPDYTDANGRNQYDNALTAISEALRTRDVDGDGHADRLVPAGIVWMQGEADAFDNQPAAVNYAANLARLISLFRAALGDDDLPVVIGRIKDSGDTEETRVMTYSPVVRAQQKAFVEGDRCATLVTASDNFGFLPDGWHYRSQDYVTLGREFAAAMRELQTQCG
ncbi:sialate O-acetylesterase [Qipengyuania sp. 6D47A]|uniref:Sialate O-acetylesterase n=2 Tax=Qipengyuania qiaonensis TaxID=2867240 RepID=A0ABS7JAP7_9SPHN|nr:sialate O-acetylesterase [Qipengyuania qiaonensis]MBX7483391.1 sialate O-acetylesterase [Qipengyuania qiaonensis]